MKGPGLRTEVALLIKVVRASLGLGNLQDGGHVIIGIDDKQLTQTEPGLTTAELASWLVYDELATTMNAYSDGVVRAGDLLQCAAGVDVKPVQLTRSWCGRGRSPRCGCGWPVHTEFPTFLATRQVGTLYCWAMVASSSRWVTYTSNIVGCVRWQRRDRLPPGGPW